MSSSTNFYFQAAGQGLPPGSIKSKRKTHVAVLMTTPPYYVPGKHRKISLKCRNDVHWSMLDYLLIKKIFVLSEPMQCSIYDLGHPVESAFFCPKLPVIIMYVTVHLDTGCW